MTSRTGRRGAKGKLQIFQSITMFTPIAFDFSECVNA